MDKYILVNEEVQKALTNNKPIVALESTIISHGMPYPQNVEMAKECERIIRENGATPATIAIIDGMIHIGLDEDQLEYLATAKDVTKVSRRDFASVIYNKKTGATTVASTMMCAEMAGIKFFATGGVGGVHRGFEKTMDISADLEELAQTNVNVICAGAKSILDLPRTLEYLETKGVPVIGYKTTTLPQFFTKDSDYKLNISSDRIGEIAGIINTKDEFSLKGGVLIVNPIPEEFSMDKQYISNIIDKAIKTAEMKHIEGKDVTPFLLAEIVKQTGGKSLEANIQLVYNNAKVAALLAVEYSHLQ